MKSMLNRVFGTLLILAAIIGMVASLFGLYAVWTNIPQTTQGIVSGMDLLHQTVAATDDLLTVIGESLDTAKTDISLIELSMENVAIMLQSTSNVTLSVGDLVGTEMTNVIQETQSGLDSAAASAKLIDDFLILVSNFPLLGARYAPEETLNASLTRVADSLTPLPRTLIRVQTDITKTSADLELLKEDIKGLSTAIGGLKTNLEDAMEVSESYKLILAELDTGLTNMENNLPGILRTFAFAITGLLVWLMFTQIAMLVQGFEMLDRAGGEKVVEVEPVKDEKAEAKPAEPLQQEETPADFGEETDKPAED